MSSPQPWSIIILGDSWAKYSHPTWPEVLARLTNSRCHNLAVAGSHSSDLPRQARQASRSMVQDPARTLVVIHTGGNDFIAKMAQVLMNPTAALEVLQPEPGRAEAANIGACMQLLYEGVGARNFLVSGVPAFVHMPIFNLALPMLQGLVNAGRVAAIGVNPGDPASLPVAVQAAALNERWAAVCAGFEEAHGDAKCLFFDEVESLHELRARMGEAAFDRQMWDMTMFHPSVWGHRQLASEVLATTGGRFPGLTLDPSTASSPGGAPAWSEGGAAAGAAAARTPSGAASASMAGAPAGMSMSVSMPMPARGSVPSGGNCKGGCGFFGSDSQNGYCSQCFKKAGGGGGGDKGTGAVTAAAKQDDKAKPKDATKAGGSAKPEDAAKAGGSAKPEDAAKAEGSAKPEDAAKAKVGAASASATPAATSPAAVSAGARAPVEGRAASERPGECTVRVQNVAGDVSFSVTCSSTATATEFRDAAIAAAPLENKTALKFTFVFRGKVMKESGEGIATLGVSDGAVVMVVVTKPKS